MWNETRNKYWLHEGRGVQKGLKGQETDWNPSVTRKQSSPIVSANHKQLYQSKLMAYKKVSHKKHLMMESKELSRDLCNLIFAKHTAGIGYGRISKQLDIPASTVGAVILKWRHYFTINWRWPGAPHKIPDRGMREWEELSPGVVRANGPFCVSETWNEQVKIVL